LFHKIEATGGAEAAAQRAAGINSLLLASRLLAAAAVGIGGSGREWQQQHKSGATMSHQQQQRGEMLADGEKRILRFHLQGAWELGNKIELEYVSIRTFPLFFCSHS
jgi:uncharacterized protein HemX